MDMLPIMIGVSLFLGGLALIAVIWGISHNQFDDPQKSNSMALYDDELPPDIINKDNPDNTGDTDNAP